MLKSIPTINHLNQLADVLMRQIQESFRTRMGYTHKADRSLVTAIDTAANETARVWAQGFDIGFVGEEGSEPVIIEHEYVLYVDPLDGTSTFIAGKAEVGVVITLMKRSVDGWAPAICVICEPLTEWKWFATRGGGVYRQRSSGRIPERMEKLQSYDSPFYVSAITWNGVPYNLRQVRSTLEEHPQMIHIESGCNSINGPLIAAGHMNAVIFGGSSATESAAISLMVTEAGGVATDLFGDDLKVFPLLEEAGKFDFGLPRGLIAASSSPLATELSRVVMQHN